MEETADGGVVFEPPARRLYRERYVRRTVVIEALMKVVLAKVNTQQAHVIAQRLYLSETSTHMCLPCAWTEGAALAMRPMGGAWQAASVPWVYVGINGRKGGQKMCRLTPPRRLQSSSTAPPVT